MWMPESAVHHNFGACILTPEGTSAGVILLIYCKQICPKTRNNLRAHSVEGFCFQSAPRRQVAYSIVCITSVSTFRGVKDQVQNIPLRQSCLLILPKPAEKKKKATKTPQLTSIFCLYFILRFFQIFLKRMDHQHWKPTSATAVNSLIYFTASTYIQLLYLTRFSNHRSSCSLCNGQKSNKQEYMNTWVSVKRYLLNSKQTQLPAFA